jgi:hypothetical protein
LLHDARVRECRGRLLRGVAALLPEQQRGHPGPTRRPMHDDVRGPGRHVRRQRDDVVLSRVRRPGQPLLRDDVRRRSELYRGHMPVVARASGDPCEGKRPYDCIIFTTSNPVSQIAPSRPGSC